MNEPRVHICAECYRPITDVAYMEYGVPYHKHCLQKAADQLRYELATDADYDRLYEPEIGGES